MCVYWGRGHKSAPPSVKENDKQENSSAAGTLNTALPLGKEIVQSDIYFYLDYDFFMRALLC